MGSRVVVKNDLLPLDNSSLDVWKSNINNRLQTAEHKNMKLEFMNMGNNWFRRNE